MTSRSTIRSRAWRWCSAYSNPSAGRHSLQIEINKRLYMDEATLQPHAGFDALQRNLMLLIARMIERYGMC